VNVTPSLVGSMRLRLFSMYKRLKIKVEEEERRREKEVSFGVLEKNTAHKKQFKRERRFQLFPKKVNFDLFSRPKSALSFWATRKYRMAHMGKKVNFCRQNYFFSREKRNILSKKSKR